jgi:hypothetical protein
MARSRRAGNPLLRIGFFLIVIGLGSIFLNAFTDYQFTLLSWADSMQPWAGMVVGLLGFVLVMGPVFFGKRSGGQTVAPAASFGQPTTFAPPGTFGQQPPAGYPAAPGGFPPPQAGFGQPAPQSPVAGFPQPTGPQSGGFPQPAGQLTGAQSAGFPPPAAYQPQPGFPPNGQPAQFGQQPQYQQGQFPPPSQFQQPTGAPEWPQQQ